MKKWLPVMLALVLALIIPEGVWGAEYFPAKAGILIETQTGRVIFARNEHERLPPASVTKVMTMLLIMEAVDGGKARLDEKITTNRNAAGMGGSQIYLREGEVMTLDKMLKAIAIVSANDASTAVAEHLYGSTEAFIDAMNRRAEAMGLQNTHFANETGLPDPNHYTSVYDVAIITRELVTKHPGILKYTSIKTDSIRNGEFILWNTNKLIGEYPGVDGLKTGHTQEAGFCLVATAKRDGMRLISVVFGAPSNGKRLELTKTLLEKGFRNYVHKIVAKKGETVGKTRINEGARQTPLVLAEDLAVVVEREQLAKVEKDLVLIPKTAPLPKGTVVGNLVAKVGNEAVGQAPVVTGEQVGRANFLVRLWWSLVRWFTNLWRRR
ncbi:MAG TPA: D-alanyl-D-alanine carboxypeptidase [Firmicutes bacterium]|jgi:D-alanyl-D-alanine carboxypeptidase (penicillin-binding protein 5/6)|nr:D-alanyl-D-alanine carboxypeptidase [Bacillota bacterium]HOQ23520.1 D-alanyl-D-alanine carboxypeptidase family protein [Bacillota bacterium]HPT68416.1 D-alanyl-D-alanine carboxypeptidase family protein [Bacillota bacterium]